MSETSTGMNAYLTMREVRATTKYSRASIYRLIAKSNFPRPHKAQPGGKVLFRANEIADWLANRPRYGGAISRQDA